MVSTYEDISKFMKEYFPAYSEKAQIAETQKAMDKFYAPDLVFDDGIINSREQWYKACLTHPKVQDKITLLHLFIDEKQKEVGALAKTQAIDRATGKILVEIRMNVLYTLKIGPDKDIKITSVKVFLETNPEKAVKLMEVYGMKK
jgi:hypothetical protein